jgi:hypothetical protein
MDERSVAETPAPAKTKRDEKLRIPVRGTNRKYYLQLIAGRPDYYVRFDVPRDIWEKEKTLPRAILRSTATNILTVARIKGRTLSNRSWADGGKRRSRPNWQQGGRRWVRFWIGIIRRCDR